MIQKVEVIPGCISCRNCEDVCPSIFHVAPKSKVISHHYEGNESEILQAELMCPVNVIKVEKKGGFVLHFKHATLQVKKWLTRDVLELTFRTEDFSAKAGQYISLRLSDRYGSFSRSYSLCEFGYDFFTLTVKILPKARGGKALKKLTIGKKCEFLGALGSFVLKDTLRPKVCIATGTGLAPMLEILRQAPSEAPKILLYGTRSEEDLYHISKFQEIQNLTIIIKISQGHTLTYKKGRVTDELHHIPQNAEVYICGNPDMIEQVSKRLEPMKQVKHLDIYKEGFTLSSHYIGKWDYHIIKGNIPFLPQLSWSIILFSLFGLIPAWIYMQSQNNLYGSFGPIENFMGFLYDLSWFSVVFVMAIRPLSDIFPKVGIFKKLCFFRKAFGILSASIIVVHWLGGFYFNPASLERYFLSARWDIGLPLIARLSELTALILLMTSNTFSQKFLGIWWKRIQRSSYVYFITGGIMAAQLFPLKVYPFMAIVGILYLIAFLKNIKK